ncbi:hypothetical protein QUB52_11655 [Microcoleus sp. A6-C6]
MVSPRCDRAAADRELPKITAVNFDPQQAGSNSGWRSVLVAFLQVILR